MESEILNLVDSEGVLARVEYGCPKDAPALVTIVVLHFSNESIGISALSETDEIVVCKASASPDLLMVDRSSGSAWHRAIGMPLFAIWELTNNQGYRDGVQFQFARVASDPAWTVQLVAAASALRIAKVTLE